MSVEALCTGDKVVKQEAAITKGGMGGQARSFSDVGAAIDCLVQDVGRGQSVMFEARGQRHSHEVFFSSDVQLTTNNRLKQTVSGNRALSVPVYLRVLAYYSEGRPGENYLWIAACEQETTRPES
jgi:hypothetical protein